MCLPQVLTSDIYERAPRYPGEPRRNRLSMVRPIGGRRRLGGYQDLILRPDLAEPYHSSMNMGMGYVDRMGGHMGGHMGAVGPIMPPPPPPPPPPMPMLAPPPPPGYNNGMHSNGRMQQPISHQFNGNDMGGQFDSGMNNRMHGSQYDHIGGQRYTGPRSPLPRGVRHCYGGSIGSLSDESYGSDRGMFQRHSFNSMDDMHGARRINSYAGY
ncbi:MAG: hypothetical protein M1840_000381 [Geoglossum simile]|nr:MAG: hypothetical protein M1840_000381 [Geoglossum simile]